jgi:hypothetical protein
MGLTSACIAPASTRRLPLGSGARRPSRPGPTGKLCQLVAELSKGFVDGPDEWAKASAHSRGRGRPRWSRTAQPKNGRGKSGSDEVRPRPMFATKSCMTSGVPRMTKPGSRPSVVRSTPSIIESFSWRRFHADPGEVGQAEMFHADNLRLDPRRREEGGYF